jgi:hypothetical protein
MARAWIFGVLILLVGNDVMGQWYTDPHNPVAVYGPVSESGGLMSDLNGGAYFFIYGPYECAMMSHVNVDGQWSCPLPGVIIGPHYSGWYHIETLDPDNNVIVHGTYGSPFPPEVPSELYKFSASGEPLWETFIFPDTLTQPTYMVSDGSGGCLIAITIGTGAGLHWYIQHFDASGQPQLGWTERPLAGTGQLSSASLISDGTGGGFAMWKIVQDSAHTIRMQHIRADGSFAYADSGIIIIEDAYYYNAGMNEYLSYPGSFIVKWATVQPPREYHFTRFDSMGAVIWDYVELNNPSLGWQYIFSDCIGGLYLFQQDDTTYSRINALGELVFTGRSLAPWSFSFYRKTVSPSGELVILYLDEVDSVWTLQKYDSLGNQVWTEAVPVLYGSNYNECLVADTHGGVILSFEGGYGTYFTRVDAFGNVGSGLHVNQTTELIPNAFQITAFPNPFNNQINLIWTTNTGGAIWINITNLLGQEVLSVELPANTTRYIWDGRDAWGIPASSGVYFCRIKVNDFVQAKKMVLLR